MKGDDVNMTQLMEIKEMLLENPEKIAEIFEAFGFAHINIRSNEIRMARDEQGGANISIRLRDNQYLNVNDFVKGFRGDIFSYIIQEKGASFRDVILCTKEILGLDDYWEPRKRVKLFGGLYENLSKDYKPQTKVYGEEILNQYQRRGNLLWLKDNISLEAQKFYDVHFNVSENSIVFPWRDSHGSIIAVKSRYNGNPPEGMSKYYYPIGGNVSNSFFNYSSCYEYLYGNDCYLFEGEKSCMIAWGRGVKNTLAIGSHSLSIEQCKLLLQLQPKTIYLMLDSSLDLMETKRNAELIKKYAPMRSMSIKFWDWRDSLSFGKKCSPMDGTVNDWNNVLKHEIKDVEELYEEM